MSDMRAPLRVTVLAGGDSPEREISLASGAAVSAALAEAGHQLTSVDPATRDLVDVDWHACDVCYIALHGGAGEDGRVQAELDRLGVAYTGSGPEACRLSMSKIASKERFAQARVPTPQFVSFSADDPPRALVTRLAVLGYPLVVKPDAGGSSLGVVVVDAPGELGAALEGAGRFDRTLLAEPLVRGREFTVAVVGERALPLLEIVSPERIFSYEAKYQSSLTEYRFDFALPARHRSELVHAAVAATQAIGARGLVRVDLMLAHDGRYFVLEVNTSPGMTARSLALQAAVRAGISLPELVDLVVRDCLVPVGAA